MQLAALTLPALPRFDDEALAIVTMRPGAPNSLLARTLAWSVLMQDHANLPCAPTAPAQGGR